MRFSLKVTLGMLLILTLALPLYTALFLNRSVEEQLQLQLQDSLASLSSLRTSMELTMMAVPESAWERALQQMVAALRSRDEITLLTGDGLLVFGRAVEPSVYARTTEAADTVVLRKSGADVVMTAVGRLNVRARRYVIVQRRSVQPLFDQQRQFAWFASGLFMAVFALTALLAALVSNRLTRPIHRIAHAVNAYARADFSQSVPVEGDDEIGELARRVRDMAQTIESQIHELTENARQKELFVASFSHEVKTPLTSVIGYAELIRRGGADPETIRAAADYIWNEGMRLEALSQKLMDLLRLRDAELTLLPVAADELRRDLEQTFAMLFEGKPTVAVELEDAYIRCEPDLLKTLLINLADNARKAGASKIEVRGHAVEQGYRVAVRDDGKGIPHAEFNNLTRFFYQVSKDRSQGFGLGLALAERIAQLHGGTLCFESELGIGTTVCFTIAGGEPDA